MFLSIFRFLGFSGANEPIESNRFVPKVKLTQEFDREATVTDAIAPHKIGQVRYRASWWRAKCAVNVTIPEGETVRVLGYSENIVLLVEPLQDVDFKLMSREEKIIS